MAKCRGCGNDTNEFMGGPGWMHYECEIERLNGLLEESGGFIESLDKAIPANLVEVANGAVKLVKDQ